jgi:uncharacterized 2Fe-2S/4Fe-4S cluster protein (DUF4445 family)
MVSAKKKLRVHFGPDNVDIIVPQGENLLKAALAAGVHINAACGGNGVCGTCKVLIKKGEVVGPRSAKISPQEYEQGYRLCCQSRIESDLSVEVPPESRLEVAVLSRETGAVQAGAAEAIATGWSFIPPLNKCCVELSPPTLKDNVSDLSRLLRSLKRRCNLRNVSVDLDIVKDLPRIQRRKGGKVTVTTLVKAVKTKADRRKPTIIKVEPGDTSRKHYSLAFDIGTTTVCGQLLDLNRGRVLAESMAYNGQIKYGADVITRIAYSQRPGGLKNLQRAVVATINQIIDELTSRSRVKVEHIGHIIMAGNTTMTHILLGFDPKYIRLAPYTPVANFIPPARARALGIEVGRYVYLFAFPCVASYIGGDIVSGVVGIGLHQSQKLTMYLDIGTNGEIVIGNSDWMVTAACSAGPAFEGGGIKHGMIAAAGAIEDVDIDPESLEPKLSTIGGEKPKGICGSGLINIIAGLLAAGVIGQNGKFNADLKSDRIRRGSDGYEYLLSAAGETQTGKDIVITEVDIDNLIRAKAAVYAGCQTLLRSVGVSPSALERVIIAGAFGSHIDIERSITIGLLPDMPRDRFIFVGNGSLTGTRLTSFSTDLLDDARKVATMMTNLELSERADFMNSYVAALFLPHTNASEFPTVMGRLEKLGKASRLGGRLAR